MKATHGKGTGMYGPGVCLTLTGDEVATAIRAYVLANGYEVTGPTTICVNGGLCNSGEVYVSPPGHVNTPKGKTLYGNGKKS